MSEPSAESSAQTPPGMPTPLPTPEKKAGGEKDRPVQEELLDDQSRRWKRGERLLVEAYLAQQPSLREDPEGVLDLLYHEVVLRQARGEVVGVEEYIGRFPDWADVLRLHFQVHQTLDPTPQQLASAGLITYPAPEDMNVTPSGRAAGGWPTVPGYVIEEELGRGGMGVVYKARQRALNRVVALKMVLSAEHADPRETSRFRREAEMVAQLQHPHIVQIYEVGEQDGRPFFSMEFVGGGSLDRKVAGTPQPAREAAQLVETLARTMHHAHEHGIIHRDLKPANILLSESVVRSPWSAAKNYGPRTTDYGLVPKITDFGLAKLLRADEAGPTQSGDLLGTPSYMAPEQIEGKSGVIGAAADVYGLGSILYELLTGRPPFKAETAMETLLLVKFMEPVSPSRFQPKLAQDLVTICMRCLQKEPRHRYASALALAEDLRRFLDGRPIRARPVGVLARTVKWVRRRPAIAALGAGIGLILALGFAGVTWQWREAEGARRTAEDRLYFNRIALAQQAWRGYQVRQADRLLDECLPTGGQDDRRSWEWHYLRRLCRASVLTLTGHEHSVWEVTYSPDRRLLASCSGEWRGKEPGEILVWDATTGDLVHTFRGHLHAVQGVAFAPDGRLLASAGFDATVRLWDLTRPQDPPAVLAHKSSVVHVAFSPDGNLLAAGCADEGVTIWDVPGRKLLRTYGKHPSDVFAVAFHPTERLIASGSRGGDAVRLWDPATGADVRVLSWVASIRSVAFSADGKLLAAGSYEGAVKIWDLSREGAEPLTHHLYAGPVLSLAFSSDGRLAWCTSTGRVKIIDPQTGREMQTLRGHDGTVCSVAFSPDGRRLATAGGDHQVRVWDVAAPQEVESSYQDSGWSYDCALSPDGKFVAVAKGISQSTERGDKLVRVWDLEKRAWGKEYRWTDYLTSVAVGPNQLAAGSEDGTAVIWDRTTAAVRHELRGHRGVVTGVAYRPDGRQLATAGADGSLRLWDTGTGQETYTVPGNGKPLSGVAYSPDGCLVAAAGADPTIRLWEVATGREVHALRGHAAAISCVAFSPDGNRLASADLDRIVRLWDLRTGQEYIPRNEPIRLGSAAVEEKRMPWDRTRPLVPRVAFSADSRRLASINGKQPIQLWDVATGLEVLTLPVEESSFQCVAFSRDGRWLVAAAGIWLHVWDAGLPAVTQGTDGR